MTEEAKTRINSIVEELSPYSLGGEKETGLLDFTIKKSIIDYEKNFYDDVLGVAKVVPFIYSPAKTAKNTIKIDVTQEGKHPTERIMRETKYNIILPDGNVDSHRLFYKLPYVSREIFIIGMVYAGFKYEIRDKAVWFFVKKNSKIEKIMKLTIRINIQVDNILNFKQLLSLDTQSQIYKHYNKCITSAETKIKKTVEKIEELLLN
jgi:hypothetical protein